jgi:hypothetical protein
VIRSSGRCRADCDACESRRSVSFRGDLSRRRAGPWLTPVPEHCAVGSDTPSPAGMSPRNSPAAVASAAWPEHGRLPAENEARRPTCGTSYTPHTLRALLEAWAIHAVALSSVCDTAAGAGVRALRCGNRRLFPSLHHHSASPGMCVALRVARKRICRAERGACSMRYQDAEAVSRCRNGGERDLEWVNRVARDGTRA